MFPTPFSYYRAESLGDALSRLEKNPDAKLLAGGHSLIPAMKLRLAAPSELVDISRLDELRQISIGDEIRIGSAVRYDELRDHAELSRLFPIFGIALPMLGDQQVRARGTFGGCLAHADPAADFTAVFLALNGSVALTSSGGERTVAADKWFVDLWTTALEPTDVLTAIVLPRPSDTTRMTYVKFRHPASGYAVVGIAAVADVENGVVSNARIALTGATSKPERLTAAEDALNGQALSDEAIDRAAAASVDTVDIIGDTFADEEYRSHLVGVYLKRALGAIRSA